jgi:hypothetical protein
LILSFLKEILSRNNNKKFEMVFLIKLLKQKVLIPSEISIKSNIHGSYFIYFSHSKILGCDNSRQAAQALACRSVGADGVWRCFR